MPEPTVRVETHVSTGEDRTAFEVAGGISISPVLEPRGAGPDPDRNVLVIRIATATSLRELRSILLRAAAGVAEQEVEERP